MKLLSIILAFNILVSTNGVTIYNHLCLKTYEQVVSLVQKGCPEQAEMEGCCRADHCGNPNEPVDDECCERTSKWFKQEMTATVVIADELDTQLPVLDLIGFLLPASISAITELKPGIQHYIAPELPPGTSTSVLQVFRC